MRYSFSYFHDEIARIKNTRKPGAERSRSCFEVLDQKVRDGVDCRMEPKFRISGRELVDQKISAHERLETLVLRTPYPYHRLVIEFSGNDAVLYQLFACFKIQVITRNNRSKIVVEIGLYRLVNRC